MSTIAFKLFKSRIMKWLFYVIVLFQVQTAFSQQRPNIIFINADDLGYGDLGCYGATKIKTPNIDRLSATGLRFTNGHTTAATCTPSRYSFMTGQYAWRRKGTGILPGDAALIIPRDVLTVPSLLQKAGYRTGLIGKWHLGLGDSVSKNWNATIKPGPNEVGFDYSFIFPATADRVPTIFMENGAVLAADGKDLIEVSYSEKVGDEPTGKEHPELLQMQSSHGHNQTIINGIGRIGYMAGGKGARWVDEEISYTFLYKAKQFIEANSKKPFFMYFASTEPHVPRMPATMFKNKSGLGLRGDAILQLDWTVGEIIKEVERLGLLKNTIFIFTSDNGPVLDDGYVDEAVERLNGHTPAGPLRGGKYSAFEGGTRVPFIVSWPGTIKAGVSDALVSHVDMLSSLATFTGQKLGENDGPDSFDVWPALSGKSPKGRSMLVEQGGPMALIKDNFKYIEPRQGPKLMKEVNIESGNSPAPQLYNLKKDIGEKNNLAASRPELVKELAGLLEKIISAGRSR